MSVSGKLSRLLKEPNAELEYFSRIFTGNFKILKNAVLVTLTVTQLFRCIHTLLSPTEILREAGPSEFLNFIFSPTCTLHPGKLKSGAFLPPAFYVYTILSACHVSFFYLTEVLPVLGWWMGRGGWVG